MKILKYTKLHEHGMFENRVENVYVTNKVEDLILKVFGFVHRGPIQAITYYTRSNYTRPILGKKFD